MGRRLPASRSGPLAPVRPTLPAPDCAELRCPFWYAEALSAAELRESAYEILFASCRSSSSPRSSGSRGAGEVSSPRFGTFSPRAGTGTGVMNNSVVKKELGLKARRLSQPAMNRQKSWQSGLAGPMSPVKSRRQMTTAGIMRRQMRVTEQSEGRLRKTVTRALSRTKADSIVLPLELLRHMKPSEFTFASDYHHWQRRQLRLLESGLVHCPSHSLAGHAVAANCLHSIVSCGMIKPIDTSKGSNAMRALGGAVTALSRREEAASPGESCPCHWADGYRLNALLYLQLLQSVFDHREETVVLDEADELLDLIKKTWPTLGITPAIHNVCFAWALFHQYVTTGETEPELAAAAVSMLNAVEADARHSSGDAVSGATYSKAMPAVVSAIQSWAEKRAMDYHESFTKAGATASRDLKAVLSLAVVTRRILSECVPGGGKAVESLNCWTGSCDGDLADYYIRTWASRAFAKILERAHESAQLSVNLVALAGDTEQLAMYECSILCPALRRWHHAPAAVAAATLHSCFGTVLKQYIGKATCLSSDAVRALRAAGELENALMQIVAKDTAEHCGDDGSKAAVKEMIPYDVEPFIAGMLESWVQERLAAGREHVSRARDTESWIPKSKSQPVAQSAVDLVKLTGAAIDELQEIPDGARNIQVLKDLADGLSSIFRDYSDLVSSCGSKQSFIPSLPPLTRCNRESRITQLWKMAAASPCRVPLYTCRVPFRDDMLTMGMPADDDDEAGSPRCSITSRGTQRLYIRLNTLHYLLDQIHSIDKSLTSSIRTGAGGDAAARQFVHPFHFDAARAAIQSAIHSVAVAAAYRIVFVDTRQAFYDAVYLHGSAGARIDPALQTLKQGLAFLGSVLVSNVQPLAVREVMKASLEAFLMVLLAGGTGRSFKREDHPLVEEDFRSLKKAFHGEALVSEDVVDREAEDAEGVVMLMEQSTERLIEELSVAMRESGGEKKALPLPLPAATGRWRRTDANTILRVLCHRDDEAANHFLKTTFHLARRR